MVKDVELGNWSWTTWLGSSCNHSGGRRVWLVKKVVGRRERDATELRKEPEAGTRTGALGAGQERGLADSLGLVR